MVSQRNKYDTWISSVVIIHTHFPLYHNSVEVERKQQRQQQQRQQQKRFWSKSSHLLHNACSFKFVISVWLFCLPILSLHSSLFSTVMEETNQCIEFHQIY